MTDLESRTKIGLNKGFRRASIDNNWYLSRTFFKFYFFWKQIKSKCF